MRPNLKVVRKNPGLTQRQCARALNKVEKILVEANMQIAIKDGELVVQKDGKIFKIQDLASSEFLDYFPSLLFYELKEE